MASIPATAATYQYHSHVPGLSAVVVPSAPTVEVAPPVASPVGDGSSKAGACASGGASSCTTFAGGTLTPGATGGFFSNVLALTSISSGKWYWEMKANQLVSGGVTEVGIISHAVSNNSIIGNEGESMVYITTSSPQFHKNGSTTGMPAVTGITTDGVVGVAYDADAHSLTFYKDCVALPTVSGLTAVPMYPAFADYTNKFPNVTFNFGASDFTCAVPSGYNAGVW